jgi:hypothetical protein
MREQRSDKARQQSRRDAGGHRFGIERDFGEARQEACLIAADDRHEDLRQHQARGRAHSRDHETVGQARA